MPLIIKDLTVQTRGFYAPLIFVSMGAKSFIPTHPIGNQNPVYQEISTFPSLFYKEMCYTKQQNSGQHGKLEQFSFY